MPRDLPIGNGSLLVNFDSAYCLRDLYFPYVGRYNHTVGHPCRVGLWIAGRFRWLHDPAWKRRMEYEPETLVTDVELQDRELGVSVHCHDAVHPRHMLVLRAFEVTNHWGVEREARLLFCQDLHIAENADGDTAYYEPVNDFVIHYKGPRYFLVNGRGDDGKGIFQYATGTKEYGGLEGTWRDAEDGELGMNPIAQGSVDSAISLRQIIPPHGSVRFRFWIALDRGYFEVKALNMLVQKEPGFDRLLNETRAHWREWRRERDADFCDLPTGLVDLYRRSLLIIRTQIDTGGAIIAANDGDSSMFNRDTYSYMWPRDGALVAHALDLAGYPELTEKFFKFCATLMPKPTYYPEGYLLHKFNPDGSLGSSWHPWVRDGKPKLPIQEDETALVLWALWHHYEMSGNRAFVRSLFERLIRPASRFMLQYRHAPTGLPLESYDLWEERYGVFTFTTAAVCAGLEAGAKFARLFKDAALEKRCREGYEGMQAAALEHLYRSDLGRFARMLNLTNDGFSVDPTIDSSLYAPFAFGVLPPDAPEMVNTMRAIEQRLWVQTPIGGVARYENDYYYRRSDDIERVPGNPWFICALWLAQWWIAIAKSRDDLRRPREILEWVAEHALPSGVLAEQLHPYTGEPLSVSPLTWSHAEYVKTVRLYCQKFEELGTPAGKRPRRVPARRKRTP
ncbi:MAG: glycoside hydrolase family 15 protein [Candidatus Rokubacteria bacterium]|nr:glycoside hydrolase family 15 protein [Candidatus Rokubacteria bacterium]